MVSAPRRARLLVLSLLLGACGGGAAAPSSTTAGASTTTTAPGVAAADVEVPPGVVWNPARIDDGPAPGTITAIAEGDTGFVAVGNRIVDGHRVAVAWRSDSGTAWVESSLPDEVTSVDSVAANVFAGPWGYLMIGVVSEDCPDQTASTVFVGSGCYRRDVFTLASTDGETWSLGRAPDGSFVDGVSKHIEDVIAAPGGGLVAAGVDKRSGPDWAVDVWTSPDGVAWTRTAVLSDEWGAGQVHLVSAGGAIFASYDVGVCNDIENVAYGEGWVRTGAIRDASRLWASTDAGATWVRVDLAGMGLVSPLPDPIDCTAYYDDPDPTTAGVLTVVGGVAHWESIDPATGGIRAFESDDGLAWRSAEPGPAPAADAITRPPGTSRSSLVEVESGFEILDLVSRDDRFKPRVWTSANGADWADWSPYAESLAGLVGPDDVSGERGLSLLVSERGPWLAYGYGWVEGAYRPVVYWSVAEVVPRLPGPDHCTPAPEADCRYADLSFADLSGADLHGIDLSGANLRGVDFSGADLSGATLQDVDLGSATLAGAILDSASLRWASLSSADLTGVRAPGADFSYVVFLSTSVDGADFDGAVLAGSKYLDLGALGSMYDVDLTGASVSPPIGEPGTWDLSGVTAHDVTFSGDLPGSSFSGADLTGAVFTGVDLTGADFSGADLTGAGFQSADLEGAHFAGATLEDTRLTAAVCPDGTVSRHYDDTCVGHFIDRP